MHCHNGCLPRLLTARAARLRLRTLSSLPHIHMRAMRQQLQERWAPQEYSSNLGEVVDIVMSHQGLPLKVVLITKLLETLVLPVPDHYQTHLRRMAALGEPLGPWGLGSCKPVEGGFRWLPSLPQETLVLPVPIHAMHTCTAWLPSAVFLSAAFSGSALHRLASQLATGRPRHKAAPGRGGGGSCAASLPAVKCYTRSQVLVIATVVIECLLHSSTRGVVPVMGSACGLPGPSCPGIAQHAQHAQHAQALLQHGLLTELLVSHSHTILTELLTRCQSMRAVLSSNAWSVAAQPMKLLLNDRRGPCSQLLLVRWLHGATILLSLTCLGFAGNSCPAVAQQAQALLEQSLLNELRSCVARALSGLELFQKDAGEDAELADDDTSFEGSSVGVRHSPAAAPTGLRVWGRA